VFDDKIVEAVKQVLVFQGAFLYAHEKLLPAAGFLLLSGKFQL
jgi:hypothetical protein